MGYIDVVILIVLALGIIRGWTTGFVGQAARLAGWVLAFLLGSVFMGPGGNLLESYGWAPPEMGSLVAFIVIFIVVKIAASGLAKSMDAAIKSLHLSGINRVAGSAAGAAKAAVLLSLVLIVSSMAELPSKRDIEKSTFYNTTYSIAPAAWNLLSREVPRLKDLKRDLEQRADVTLAG
jgi:membrane protein required for colicin V production